MPKDDSFDKKFLELQKEAISQGIRLVRVTKGEKRTPLTTDSSVGKQRKGINKKRVSGEGVYYSQAKERMSITLTPQMKSDLTSLAEDANLSRSEVIERCLRVMDMYPNLKPLVLEYITCHKST